MTSIEEQISKLSFKKCDYFRKKQYSVFIFIKKLQL